MDSRESFPTAENAFVYSILLVIVLMKSIMVLKEIGPRWQQDRVAAWNCYIPIRTTNSHRPGVPADNPAPLISNPMHLTSPIGTSYLFGAFTIIGNSTFT